MPALPEALETMSHHRTSQRDRIFCLLLANKGEWVTIPQLLELRIVDYRRRIHEIRKLGWNVETMPETWKDGYRLSGYKLIGWVMQ
jgi:hypothetical protein